MSALLNFISDPTLLLDLIKDSQTFSIFILQGYVVSRKDSSHVLSDNLRKVGILIVGAASCDAVTTEVANEKCDHTMTIMVFLVR